MALASPSLLVSNPRTATPPTPSSPSDQRPPRHPTGNLPKKCRGCAFVDFDTGSHMRTCLDKMHGSSFDDGRSSRPKILNLELTAGGGGNAQARTDKLKEKNRALVLNRARRLEADKEAREAAKKAKAAGEDAGGEDGEQRPEQEKEKRRGPRGVKRAARTDHIHPSRRQNMGKGQ
jgi:RNA recognition motif-containing protein